jgi:hypothetical protein
LDNAAAQLTEWSVGRPEGAEDRGGSWVGTAIRDEFVGYFVNEAVKPLLANDSWRKLGAGILRFKSKDVGDALSFISDRVADLTYRVDETHSHHPLVWGKLDVSCKVVKMFD